jgi:hypothetical protein
MDRNNSQAAALGIPKLNAEQCQAVEGVAVGVRHGRSGSRI